MRHAVIVSRRRIRARGRDAEVIQGWRGAGPAAVAKGAGRGQAAAGGEGRVVGGGFGEVRWRGGADRRRFEVGRREMRERLARSGVAWRRVAGCHLDANARMNVKVNVQLN